MRAKREPSHSTESPSHPSLARKQVLEEVSPSPAPISTKKRLRAGTLPSRFRMTDSSSKFEKRGRVAAPLGRRRRSSTPRAASPCLRERLARERPVMGLLYPRGLTCGNPAIGQSGRRPPDSEFQEQ